MKVFKSLFPFFVLLGAESYTIITGMFGVYASSSLGYIIFNISMGIICWAVSVFFIISNHMINRLVSTWVALSLFIPVIYLGFRVISNYQSTTANNFFYYFLLWSMPAFLFGIVIACKEDYWLQVQKYIDWVMIAITITVILNALAYSRTGRTSDSGVGHTSYQTISYLSAFAFGINYYLLVTPQSVNRFEFFLKSKLYKSICCALMILQLIALIISGGRGGIVLVVIYLLVFPNRRSYRSNRDRTLSIIKKILLLCILIFGFIVVLNNDNEAIVSGRGRVFAFLSESGFSWKNTSGRDSIYSVAIERIKESPIIGYGMFSQFYRYRNPHNIFLELLLGGGIIGFVFSAIIWISIWKKYKFICRDNNNQIIGVIMLYNLVMLMFSGTFLVAPALWFGIGFIITRYSLIIENDKLIMQ